MGSKWFLKCLPILALLLAQCAWADLAPLNESELSGVTGQALIDTTKHIGDGTSTNGSSGVTFYTMGLDAQMDLNVNINHLQLGCGGVNGAGACDIDINNFSLSGVPGVGNCPTGATSLAGCDAVFTRPSITLAITGDTTPFRQVVGFQLSAQKLQGQMTAGINDGTANGINALSGAFSISATTGTTAVAQDNIDISGGQITGAACVTVFGLCSVNANYKSSAGTLVVPAIASVPFNVPAFNYYGFRNTSSTTNTTTSVNATSTLGSTASPITLPQEGPLSMITTSGISGITLSNVFMNGGIANMGLGITLTEALGYLHVFPLSNPFSLSFERQTMVFPGTSTSSPATPGWFMGVVDPISLGVLSTPTGYAASIDTPANNAAIEAEVSAYLNAHVVDIPLSSVIGNVFGGSIYINLGTMQFGSYGNVPITLANLPLGATQTPVPNCYGSYKFC